MVNCASDEDQPLKMPLSEIRKIHRNHSRHWDSKQLKRVKTLFKRGTSIGVICDIMGRSHNSILARLHDMGLIDQVPELFDSNDKPLYEPGVEFCRNGKPFSQWEVLVINPEGA